MPLLFDKLGVRFAYPDNWELEEQDLAEGHGVTVSSPAGAFWWMSWLPASSELVSAVEAVLKGLQQEYDNLDVEAVEETVAGQALIGFDVNFYCLDLTNTAQVRGFQTLWSTYVILWQVEDRDLPAIEPVLRAMTASLVMTACEDEDADDRDDL